MKPSSRLLIKMNISDRLRILIGQLGDEFSSSNIPSSPGSTMMPLATAYRTWARPDRNPPTGSTVYTVACHLSDGLQADVFAFEADAYLYLVDQAEGPTDEERIELEKLAQSPDRAAFWDLFQKSVLPTTTYRIESHVLQLQRELFVRP
jgi:hypothetical protein